MIIETIFSTMDVDGKPNFAPMGIIWGDESVVVRPYCNTQTARNLLANGYGVANLSDDVLAFVQCGLYDTVLPYFAAKKIPGIVFHSTCSWQEVSVVARKEENDRLELQCRVLHQERQRDFLGFCRARNAVIEAAILATRWRLVERKILMEKLIPYGEIVRKTGSDNEKEAFRLVCEYIQKGEE